MITRSLTGDIPYYRLLSPAYANLPLSGMGAAAKGGRFNRPGQEALYLAGAGTTAMVEYQQDNPWLPPGMLCSYAVDGLNVADFSAGYDAVNWPPLWAQHAVDWRAILFHHGQVPPTWLMADSVVNAGLDGLLFPSKAHPGGVNLVIYNSSSRPASQLSVHDPANILSKIRVVP